MDQSAPDADRLREEIDFNNALYNSLKDDDHAEIQRSEIAERVKFLTSQLATMQPPPPPLPRWGHSTENNSGHSEAERPNSGAASVSSNNSFASATQFYNNSLSADLELRSRKRTRPEDAGESPLPFAKTRKPTPQPHATTQTHWSDDFDFFDDELKAILGDKWQDEGHRNKKYLEDLESKRLQEEEDAAFARQLQEKWNQDFRLEAPSKSGQTTSSFNQSYMNPDGTWQKPSSQPLTSHIKPEFKPENMSTGTITPLTDSSGGLEEISALDWDRRFANMLSSSNHMSVPGHRGTASSSFMPGTFPNTPINPYASVPGSAVYGRSYNPYSSTPQSSVFTTVDSWPLDGTGRGMSFTPLGSAALPFDLTALGTPPYLHGFEGSADPEKTQEEIKDLLKHIRPDEELTEEQLQEVQPARLQINLMAHQRKGFAWMKIMEEGTNKGGILADDMGLGKTVQAISLILARPPDPGVQKPTLVVAPVALMQQWEREIKKFVSPQKPLKVLILHQENRNKSWEYIRGYDVVLTTYGTLSSDLKRKIAWDKRTNGVANIRPKPQEECPILGQHSAFHRVILDEAQNIKNKNTKAAVAACRIKAEYRWCLSGTPMQNNVDEIFSLIKFCRIRPYHDYEKFARDIGRPLKRTSDWGKEKAMKQLQAILKAILLRRTKESKIDGQPIIQLPEKRTVENRAVFSEDELDFYQQLEQRAQIQFNRFLKQGTVGRHYSHALVLLLRLRQCCCSPQLVTNAKDFMTSGPLAELDRVENARLLGEDVVRRLGENDAYECPICMDAVENPIIFVPCGHALCNECLQAMADKAMTDTQFKLNCPHCRADVDMNKVTDLESYFRVFHPDRPGVEPLDNGEEAESDSELDSNSSETEQEEKVDEDDDDAGSLDDFIVPDDQDDFDSDTNNDNKKSVLEYLKEEEMKPAVSTKKITFEEEAAHLSEPEPKSDLKSGKITKGKGKGKGKGKARHKGKGKAKQKTLSLADLRREGLKSKAAKKKYLKQLAKGFEMSTKIQRTLDLLQEIKDRGEGEKTIVFSSFTSFLDLLEVPLHRDEDLSEYARYDGSMKAADRNNAVIRFSDDPACKIMLVSLKAGNAGLNLTAANHVIILDPFWNPFVEYQAADRCYRIGQKREVTIHRILIGETADADAATNADKAFTVEDRILQLQEKKRKLVETALDENAAMSLGRLTTRDLGFLFGVNAMD